jgi:hypothetical protein
MNCKDVTRLLPRFLAHEVTPSEGKLIQNHLASCTDCQNEMRVLTVLQHQIRESLQKQAAESAPSPQAWSHLQARLDSPTRAERPILPTQWLTTLKQKMHEGAFDMKKIVYAALAGLALIAGTIAFVPGVRAEVLKDVKGWLGYDFPSPSGRTILSLSTNWGFSPFSPTHLPDGLEPRGIMTDGDEATETLGLCYQPDHRELGDPFIVILQHHLGNDGSLPDGKIVNVNGVDGVVDTLPAGEIDWCLGPSPEEVLVPVPEGQGSSSPDTFPADEPLVYDKALRLTYYIDEVKIEIFGPYSKAELIRIAKSLQQANPALDQQDQPAANP